MQVIVKARHMVLTPSLKAHAEVKLGEAVMRIFDRPAAKIDIELSLLGHITDGRNQECRVTVFMPGGKTAVICEADDNMYKAIDMAHHRLLLKVNRERGKTRNTARTRKLAARTRDLVARRSLTVQPEAWEKEVAQYERSVANL
jgi:putative sigma-54 modulation protein